MSGWGTLNVQAQNIGARTALDVRLSAWLSEPADDPLDRAVWDRLTRESATRPSDGEATSGGLAPGERQVITGFVEDRVLEGGAGPAVMYAKWSYSDEDGNTFEGASDPLLLVEVGEATALPAEQAPSE